MIAVTCRNGEHFSVDPDAIERVETDPDTVIHLVDGRKYVVAESFDELLSTISAHRAAAVVAAQHLTDRLPPEPPPFRVERRRFSRDGSA
ncbi:MAG: flagellar FlbD family protein [Actinomycetota bacterium]|nr:flagellar FlbD family protein [Actinomycetota bacterium]